MTLLAIAMRYLGLTGMVAIGIVLFYEGLPLGPIRYVPFIGPVLEQFVDGRVDRERRAALEGYVRKVELDAANAEHAKTLRLLEASRRATEGFQELLAAEQERNRVQEEQDRIEDGAYEKRLAGEGRSCPLSDDDIRHIVR